MAVGAISQVHLNKSIKAYPNMKKKPRFSAFLTFTFGCQKPWPSICATVYLKHGWKKIYNLAQFHQLGVLKQKPTPRSELRFSPNGPIAVIHYPSINKSSMEPCINRQWWQMTDIFRLKLLNIINSHHLKQPRELNEFTQHITSI